MELLLLLVLYATGLSVLLARSGHHSRFPASGATRSKPPTRILVVGATGGTGRELVTQALARGMRVTALVRNPTRLQIKHSNLRLVQGDVLDPASIDLAMSGQDAVVSALGHKRFFYPTRILSQGTRNLLKAMETHRVSQFVCETSLGIGNSAGRMGLYYTFFVIPFILPFYFWDKTRQEREIAASGVNWTIVRPGALNDGARRDRVRHGPDIGSFVWTVRISRANVAEFMLDQLEYNTYLRAAPGVAW